MTGRTITLDFSGLDRYCPSCRRQLVKVHPNGTFDLAGKASVMTSAEVDLAGGAGHAIVVEAECLLWRCRLRRWLRR